MALCRIEGCNRKLWHSASGLCQAHARRHRAGLPLGPIRHKEPRWKPAEIDWLLAHLGRHTYASMGRELGRRFGFTRTAWAVRVKAKRLGVSILTVDGHYSPCRLAKMLGLPDAKAIVRGWRSRGLVIRRTRMIAGSSGQRIRLVDPAALRRFLAAHPEACDLRRASKRDLCRLGLDDLPLPPACKILRCSQGHDNVVPLHPPPRMAELCRTCGRSMPRWALSYSQGPPSPFRVHSSLEDMPYYDPAADRLQCLDCGAWLRGLAGHIRTHGYRSAIEYRAAHALPPDAPLLNKSGRYNLGHNWGRLARARRRAAQELV